MNVTIRVEGNYRRIERLHVETPYGEGVEIVGTANTNEDQLMEVMRQIVRAFIEKMDH